MSYHLYTIADKLACPSKRRLPVTDAGVRDDVLAYLFLLNSFFLHYDGPSMNKALLCISVHNQKLQQERFTNRPYLLMKPRQHLFTKQPDAVGYPLALRPGQWAEAHDHGIC